MVALVRCRPAAAPARRWGRTATMSPQAARHRQLAIRILARSRLIRTASARSITASGPLCRRTGVEASFLKANHAGRCLHAWALPAKTYT